MDKINTFQNPEYLIGLVLVPLLIGFFWYVWKQKKKLIMSFGDVSLVSQLMPEISKRRPLIKFSILLGAFVLMIFALANPQAGQSSEVTRTKGIELIIALDVSNSMLANDIHPSRLEKAKEAISKLVDKIANDKVGIVVFAGEAFVQLPLTYDHNVVHTVLRGISTGSVPVQGTAIDKGLETAINAFNYGDEKQDKVVILFTDGEDHGEQTQELAMEAASKGIIIHTIGIGDPKGAPIPVANSGNKNAFKKDETGKIVISKLNEEVLKSISEVSKGKYQLATNLDDEIESVISDLNSLEKQEMVQTVFSNYEDYFPYFIFAALLFLISEFLIGEGKRAWVEKIKKL